MNSLYISIFKTLFVTLTLIVPGNALAQSSASLDRMVSQIESLFPSLEGYVIAVEGSGLTLDLKQGMPVEPGDRLKLIRYGRELFHPVTKKKLAARKPISVRWKCWKFEKIFPEPGPWTQRCFRKKETG